MKYLFDIGHPGEFHLFKHVIRLLRRDRHDVLITARDKDVTLDLLGHSGFDYRCTGKNLPSRLGKLYSLLRNEWRIYRVARSFNPDLVINFFSPFAAHVGKWLGKPVIGFHDTEGSGISAALALPFTDQIVVPRCYRKALPPDKKIDFPGVFELAYLHPRYFTPDPGVPRKLGIKDGEPYSVIRFVSHHALHDSGYRGPGAEYRRRVAATLGRHARVFISSEDPLPEDLRHLCPAIEPTQMHDLLAFASLLYGESATMASEAAVLGVPAYFIHHRGCGYTRELEEKYRLVRHFGGTPADGERALRSGENLLRDIIKSTEPRDRFRASRAALLAESTDVTEFMYNLIRRGGRDPIL